MLTTDPVLLVCWLDNDCQRTGGGSESSGKHGRSKPGTGGVLGRCRRWLVHRDGQASHTGELLSPCLVQTRVVYR